MSILIVSYYIVFINDRQIFITSAFMQLLLSHVMHTDKYYKPERRTNKSQSLHSICFLFPIQFLLLDTNLLKDNSRKGSRLTVLVLAPSLASQSVVLFCWMPLCPNNHSMVGYLVCFRRYCQLFYTVVVLFLQEIPYR